MVKKHYIKLDKNDISCDIPILWEVSFSNDKSVCILQSNTKYNPCDYVDSLFYNLSELIPGVQSVFIDLKNFYGKYTDSWFWKCTFILDDSKNLDDVICEDIQNVELSITENGALKEYLYNSMDNKNQLAQ
ncbi:MAG: hypothetical protein E7J31_04995 [Clostridium sp.]|uniref:hypothetical protein n=1 Tax=Clostridium sp. TaxID=1506 RepID=UPI002909420C|nr:hypothetical protein [Clostridium sp.]MDU7947774.1 hypothetical protein [Clostridium sp.]